MPVVAAGKSRALREAARVEKTKETAPPPPKKREDTADEILKGVRDWGGAAGAVGVSLSEGPFQWIAMAALGLAVAALGAHLVWNSRSATSVSGPKCPSSLHGNPASLSACCKRFTAGPLSPRSVTVHAGEPACLA